MVDISNISPAQQTDQTNGVRTEGAQLAGNQADLQRALGAERAVAVENNFAAKSPEGDDISRFAEAAALRTIAQLGLSAKA